MYPNLKDYDIDEETGFMLITDEVRCYKLGPQKQPHTHTFI